MTGQSGRVVVELDTRLGEQGARLLQRRAGHADRHRRRPAGGCCRRSASRRRTPARCRSPGCRAAPPSAPGSPPGVKVAVSEARMPSLCSSRSSFRPGLSRSTMNDLIAARPLRAVERRPDDDQVGALAGGDVDLLAVQDVLVAVELGRRADRRRVRAGLGLGDRHRRPAAAVALAAAPRLPPRRSPSCRGPGGAWRAAARHRPSRAR